MKVSNLLLKVKVITVMTREMELLFSVWCQN